MAVLTQQPVGATAGFCKGWALLEISDIYGGNSFERKKPDPMGVERFSENSAPHPRK